MIVHPSVQQINCEFVKTIDVSLGGMAGSYRPGGGGVFGTHPATVIKDGIVNWYFCPNWSKGNYSYPSILRFDGENFSWFNGDQISKTSVNQSFDVVLFTSDGIIYNDPARGLIALPSGSLSANKNYLPMTSLPIPPAPCSPASFHAIYSDSDLIVIEYIVPYPEDYYLFTRTGFMQNGNFVTVNSGFVGIIPNGQDPVVINPPSGFTYGFSDTRYNFTTAKYLVGTDIYLDASNRGLNVINCDIVPGTIDCSGNGKSPTMRFTNLFSFSNRSIEFVGTNFYNHYQSNIVSNTDLKGVGATFNNYGAVGLYTKDEFVELNGGATYITGYMVSCVYCNATNLVYYLYVNSANHLCIDVAKPRIAVFLKSYANVKHTPNGLVNFHRPVSILGAYKT